MTLSKLIRDLQDIEKQHGDLKVYLKTEDIVESPDVQIDNLSINSKPDNVRFYKSWMHESWCGEKVVKIY